MNRRFDAEILAAARRHGVPAALLKACAMAESGLDPRARRYEPHLKDESRGLGQLLTVTARDLGEPDPERLWDPARNLDLAALYLRQLYDRFPEIPSATTERWRFAVASYNAGRGRVNRALQKARDVTAKTIEQSGVWREWWFTRDFLDGDPRGSSGAEQTTKNHLDRVWSHWREVLLAGDFMEAD